MAPPTVLSLFSGVGGLDLGIQIVYPGARVLGYVERDSYAAAVLLARMEDSSLETAPVFIGDICDLGGSCLLGRVDIICGGFPCQDISLAGKGVGIEGKRSGLWSEIVRLADEIRPRYIFLENVSAITSRGLDTVLADLAEGGFNAEWLCLRASAVGAPHRRERWFCLAYRDGTRAVALTEASGSRGATGERGGCMADAASGDGSSLSRTDQRRLSQPDGRVDGELAHTPHERHERAGGTRRGRGGSEDHGESVANPTSGSPRHTGATHEPGSERLAGAAGERMGNTTSSTSRQQNTRDGLEGIGRRGEKLAHAGSAAVRRDSRATPQAQGGDEGRSQKDGDGTECVCSAFPPGPADTDAWREVIERWPHLAPTTQSGLHILVDGKSLVVDQGRADQLRCSGNGVVVLQAACAFVELMRRIEG